MAQATMNPPAIAGDSQGFRLTRQLVAGIAFLLVGIVMFLRVPGDIAPDASTLLVFGDGIPDIPVPVQAFGFLAAAVFLLL